ncbi:hypothetical protein BsWGS_17084 [Bradybaena similaris]
MSFKVWLHALILVKFSIVCVHIRTRPCPTSSVPIASSNVIKIGVLLPFTGNHLWVLQATFPAIQLATERVQNASDILPGYKFVLNLADSACSETFGPLAAIDMYVNQSANVFIGPACEYAIAPVARFSYYWGIPVLTAGAMVSAFGDKNEYRLLTRVQGPLSKASEFILDLCELFHWKNMIMLYSDKKGPNSAKMNCYFSAEAMVHSHYLRYNERPPYVNFDEGAGSVDFAKLLKECSLLARSKVVSGHEVL